MIFAEIDKKPFSGLPFLVDTLCDYHKQVDINRPDGFDHHHILWVRSGCGHYRVRDDAFLLSEGEGVFMRAGVPHSYGGNDLYTAWCTFTLPTDAFDHMGLGDYLKFKVPSTLNGEIEQLVRFANGNSNVFTRSAAGYSFVIELLTSVMLTKEGLAARIDRVLRQRYAEPLTLVDISDAVGADRFSICRIYKRERGVTVMEELKRIRIKKAKQLLKYNVASVEETGRLCGFESPSYFVKRFRETVGCTPLDYRRKHI